MFLERVIDFLFERRVSGHKTVWEMTPTGRRRVLWSSNLLRVDEERAQEVLGLKRRPRLLIFDEEAAVLVTAEERDELSRAVEQSDGELPDGPPDPPAET